MIRRLVVAASLLAGGAAAPGQGQEAPPLVAAAAAAVEARAEPGQRWSFIRTMTRGPESLSAAYDPSLPPGEQWSLVAPSSVDELTREMRSAFERFAGEEAPDLDVILGEEEDEDSGLDELLGDDLTLVRDDGSVAVFTFTPRETEGLRVAEAMAGELMLSSVEPMVTSLRFFAVEAFKPNPAARITSLDVTLRFGETAPGGPIAIVATDTYVAGSALFRSFEETVSIANSDFVRVAIGSDPQPAE